MQLVVLRHRAAPRLDAEIGEHPPTSVLLVERRVDDRHVVHQDFFERPPIGETRRAIELESPIARALGKHPMLAAPSENERIGKMVRRLEHRTHRSELPIDHFGDGNMPLLRAVKQFLDENKVTSFVLDWKWIGPKTIRRRKNLLEMIVARRRSVRLYA